MLTTEARCVEAILFIENEALTVEKLSAMSGLEEKECRKALRELKTLYEKEGHGLFLKENEDDTVCFAPCPDLYDRLRQTY